MWSLLRAGSKAEGIQVRIPDLEVQPHRSVGQRSKVGIPRPDDRSLQIVAVHFLAICQRKAGLRLSVGVLNLDNLASREALDAHRQIDRVFEEYRQWLDETRHTEREPYIQVVAVLTGQGAVARCSGQGE